MAQSVELLLDPEADAAVRREWSLLDAAGLPSQARHRDPSNRPHLTLAVARRVPAEAEAALVLAVAGLPLRLRLGGMLVFGTARARVLSRLVVPSAELLALHAAVAEATSCCEGLVDVTRPGRWTPHVTLARRLAEDELPAAVALLEGEADLEARGVAVRRWDGEARREWIVSAAR